MSGERLSEQDNGDGTLTEVWSVPHPLHGQVGLALADFLVVHGICGSAGIEIYGMPGESGDGFPIVPETYKPILEELCGDYRERFGDVAFGTLRVAGVDERFNNGLATPGLILVPNFTFDDDGSGSFLERDFFLGHELAHQWFGNDMEAASASDAWLVEGTADYVTCTTLEALRGAEIGRWIWLWEVGPLLDFLDGGGVDHALVPEPGTDMEPVVYYVKGAWVLRMLASAMEAGALAVDDVLAVIRAGNPFGILDTADFVARAEAEDTSELDWFFTQWLSGTGVMSLTETHQEVEDGIEVTITQGSAWQAQPEGYYRMPVWITTEGARRGYFGSILLTGRVTTGTVSAYESH
jgi:hypothetical protein